MDDDLNRKVRDLAILRKALEQDKADFKALVDEFEKSEACQYYRTKVHAGQSLVAAMDLEVRCAGLHTYLATREMHPHPALGIRNITSLIYDDREAREYCLANLPAVLTVDKKRFEKVAVELGLDFVTLQIEPQVTIATNLSKWLEEA